MTRALDDREAVRKRALTEFLDARVREGYRIETRTDTHAIIAPARRRTLLDVFRRRETPARQVLSVDSDGVVHMRPAEPLRS
jgi:hypothetical protein